MNTLEVTNIMDRNLQIRNSWIWWLLLGVMLLVIGVVGIFSPVALSMSLIYALGWFFLVFGIMVLYFAFSAWRIADTQSKGIIIFQGVFDFIFGLILIWNPFSSTLALILVLGIFLIVKGIGDFFNKGYRLTLFGPVYEGRGSMVFNGIFDIVFGILAIIAPLFMEGVIGFIIAFYMIFIGVEMIVMALKLKNL